ncbi:DUF2075 domain-containing protein [Microcoleus sp. FACHB-1515]|uniref:DNA/RNA helicase domain-containing protein n=1 Tax=Cyanophyceae TaxID=3028117 RepID=UPI0016830039|nr:DNA/RNA helicase domain-containing protein [Microcoleus sp. FACHB-1515]MBD2092886.1 DUF2075 domain-containing protein [Microcoleus sp. FACHB-1515]
MTSPAIDRHTADMNQLSLLQSLPYGWMGTIAQFLDTDEADWLAAIETNYQQLYRQRSTATQQQAWQDCYQILRSQLVNLRDRNWTLIFEYELPREGGRRPDLVLLADDRIFVFEFKQKSTASAADLDQVAAYARDLSQYHSQSVGCPIQAIVVPTRRQKPSEQRGDILMLNPNEIAKLLNDLNGKGAIAASGNIDPQAWVQADYEPLPTIIQAAKSIFEQEPLPNIKRAHSARIPDLIAYLNEVVDRAQANRERHLVLVTGVPGAGKTLVGLQFVYQTSIDQKAVFLSGNAPLITVLQYALKSRVFVQSIRNFYIDHEVRKQKAPREQIIVFDEAQRAWDADRMAEKYGITSAAAGAVLRIAERTPDWCVVLGLIGEGQEIHVGEEEGTEQWNRALEVAACPWQVHCSPQQAGYFTSVPDANLHTDDLFNLTTSLRTHLAQDLQTWVAQLLTGDIAAAAATMPRLSATGYNAYLTRDLEAAKAYCRDRYLSQPDKRYGLLASSRARNLVHHGIANDYMATQRLKAGPWYIDPPDSPLSCRALDSVVTEFACQGLEVDFAIVGWGDDLLWCEGQWRTSSRQKNVRDPLRLRLNSYRVLLTRGRDGFVVFVPPEAKMDAVFDLLRSSGLPLLVD